MDERLPSAEQVHRATASDADQPGANRVALAIGWALVVAAAGGLACGWIIDRFGEFGSISLWGLGALAGVVSRKITRSASPLAAWSQVAACAVALVLAEVCWIRWNIVLKPDTWEQAIATLPTFVEQYQLAALIAALFTAFGAYAAWWRAGARYRLVAVEIR
ncbi:MAG: hypothetical protein WD847_10610 [Pirellulales bacterium]